MLGNQQAPQPGGIFLFVDDGEPLGRLPDPEIARTAAPVAARDRGQAERARWFVGTKGA